MEEPAGARRLRGLKQRRISMVCFSQGTGGGPGVECGGPGVECGPWSQTVGAQTTSPSLRDSVSSLLKRK